jgi:integrase
MRQFLPFREITRTLNTSDRQIAMPRCLALAAKVKHLFYNLRQMSKNKNLLQDGIPINFEFEINFNDFGKPKSVKVQAEPHEQDAVVAAITAALGSTAPSIFPAKAIVEKTAPSAVRLVDVATKFLEAYPTKKEGMLKKHKACIPAFCEVVGDMPITELRRTHVKEFFEILHKLPPRWSDIKRKEGLTIRQIALQKHELLLNEKTFSYTYKTSINQFLSWARENFGESGFPGIPITTIRYEGKRKAGEKKQRAFKPSELKRLFEGPEMKEFASTLDLARFYWLPAIGLFTGARVNEICQLNPQQDILKELGSGIWYFWITEETESDELVRKSTKNTPSTRKVPIHSKLIELGFLDYFNRVKATGATLIFPGWRPSKGRASGAAEKWFREFLRNCGLRDETPGCRTVGMHAFRHTLSNAALNAGVDESHLVGHVGGESAVARGYRGELSLVKKQEIIEKILYDINFIPPCT